MSSLTVAQMGKWGWVARPQTSPSMWPWKKKKKQQSDDFTYKTEIKNKNIRSQERKTTQNH